ncbi:hypothetical protein GO988_07490 [Hymenobacter sp. HMF4947]|uniref:DUF4148 domain-containing protein n=1 Tax=Hymenobacter ginkgonis TaxID=2682976 RepID=A0A7K1TCM2_9BACT|nr:hypothetical protein [Hymenobacter ginkgonis]MVN76164.1 hypothetical protein [Hymenobacter ginkgonis]
MFRSSILAVAWLLSTVALAQIAPTSPARQRAENRRALREARATEAEYKDSHLDVTRQHLKRGGLAAPAPLAGEPRFDRDGTPHVTTPKYPGLRRRKAQVEPGP